MNYRSICSPSVHEKVIERSRFIADCAHVCSEEEARAFVASVRAKHPLATHHCFAFIADEAGNLQRFSDDGEPQGTAGMPMLEVLKAQELRCSAVVVTRYFGGVKLGAGGLVRAYAGTCAEALSSADIRVFALCRELSFSVGYDLYDALRKYLEREGAAVRSTEYGSDVCVRCAVEEERARAFAAGAADFLAGRVAVREGECFRCPVTGACR